MAVICHKTMNFYCEWLQLALGVRPQGVGTSEWLGCWWDQIFAGFLSSAALCYFLFPVPGLVLSTHGSILHPLLLTLHLSTAELFHALLLRPAAAAAFLFLSSHPVTSHPIFLQIWGFNIDFPSDPLLHTFVSCTYPWNVSPTSLFSSACLTGEGSLSRSSGHMQDLSNHSGSKRAGKVHVLAETGGLVKPFW